MLDAKSAFLLTLMAPAPLACAGATSADRSESPEQVPVGHFGVRCDNLQVDAGAPPGQVLVELGVYEVSLATSRRWRNEAPTYEQLVGAEGVKFVASLHILATTDAPAEITVSETPAEPKPYERLRVRPSFPSSDQVDLEFSYGGTEGTRRLHAEELAVVRLREEEGHPRMGVFVAHYVWSQDDLRRLYECKTQQRSQKRR